MFRCNSAAMTWLGSFGAVALQTNYREWLRGAIGVLLGIALTGAIATAWFGSANGLPLLIAPLGASAVLLFGVPASPLAQPWPILAGNTVSAAIGVACAHGIGSPLAAAAASVALAFAAMSVLRCVHPPGGAVALSAVIGGPYVAQLGYEFILAPVLLNSALLAIGAVLYNNLTGRSYPHRAHAPEHPHPPRRTVVLEEEDFAAVLADYGETLDISREDLEVLYRELLGRAENKRHGPAMVGQGELDL
ncbi:MAG: hypothetical protein JWM75_1016 [Sphingomonas bacterium]|nr:hypothetical protein [Sphingomonas bacterium]